MIAPVSRLKTPLPGTTQTFESAQDLSKSYGNIFAKIESAGLGKWLPCMTDGFPGYVFKPDKGMPDQCWVHRIEFGSPPVLRLLAVPRHRVGLIVEGE